MISTFPPQMEIQALERTIISPDPPEPYDSFLQESIIRFLSDHRDRKPVFLGFTSIFSRHIQTMPDPSLEFVWFYALVSCHSRFGLVEDPFNRVMATKELLRILVSFSSSFSRNGYKRIAILAPVVFELHELMWGCRYSSFKTEIDCLIEGVASYLSMCCCDNDFEETDEHVCLGRCFEGLIRMWTVDRVEVGCQFEVSLKLFFPLVSDKVRSKVYEGCEVGYLAGVVMFEALVLRLWTKLRLADSDVGFKRDLGNLALNTIIGFRNFYFIDILFGILLEQSLSSTSLSSSEAEFLQEGLFSAVIVVDYSFFTPCNRNEVPSKHLKDLALTWLFVADKAVQSARENEDLTREASCIHAFSKSRLRSQLIEWIVSQAGRESIISTPYDQTPLALINWLLVAEDQGAWPSDNGIPSFHARAKSCKSRTMTQNGDNADYDQNMVDSSDDIFTAGSSPMSSAVIDSTRKRKECSNDDSKKQMKFFKAHLHENLGENRSFCL